MPKYKPDLNAVFTALADPTRRGVLANLCLGPKSVSELAEPFDMALPSFTQHLKVLEKSGLVHSEKKGRTRTYQVVPEQLAMAEEWLEEQRAIWNKRLDQLDSYLLQLKEKRK